MKHAIFSASIKPVIISLEWVYLRESHLPLNYVVMLAFLCSAWVMLAIVEGQGGGPPGQPPEQECVLVLTSPIYVCEDDVSKSYMDATKTETVRHNDSVTYITGSLILLKTIDLDSIVEIILFKSANGKKEMVLTHEIKLCQEMGREDSDYFNMLQYLGFPPKCPIEPGSYPIHNMVVDMDDLPINSGNIGDYEATMNFLKCEDADCKEKIFEACVKLDCVIEPI